MDPTPPRAITALTMATLVDTYNSLPSIMEASSRFTDRDTIFAKLAPILSHYDHQFGVCLVHAHCALNPGEKMIATGNVSQPEDVTGATFAYHPERWLANGEPYEFTREHTASPPPELLTEFNKIVGNIGVLGLYFAGVTSGEKRLEWTEGRKNITKVISEPESEGHVETAWIPGTQDPVQFLCTSYCNPIGGGHDVWNHSRT